MRLLIAIPVFNERRHVEQVLARVLRERDQVLVVDDGSTDGTPELLGGRRDIHLLRHGKNLGYGRSLIDAFQWAHERAFDWVITMDCDDQHEPEAIPEFVREIETDRWDLISGSRYLLPTAEGEAAPRDRREINQKITALLNAKFGVGITDAFCGFKAHRVGPTIALELTESGYAFPLQLWPRVARSGLRLREIPVRLIYNDPNRHFGGSLDNADRRLRHYLDVLEAEIDRPAAVAAAPAAACSCNCT